jgi:transposase
MDLYDTTNINPLAAGGTMLVKRMDELVGHSKLLKPLRCKGVPLDKVANCMVAQRIDEPTSILGTHRAMKNSAAPVEFRLEVPSERNFNRAVETLGLHAEELYPKIVERIEKAVSLDLRESFIDWSSIVSFGDARKMAKRGYSRDHRPDLTQVKLGVCLAGSVPLYYSLDEGNVPDIRQFGKDLEKLSGRLPRRSLLVFDKGGNSEAMRKSIRERGLDYLTVLKDTRSTKALIESVGSMELVREYGTGEKVYGAYVRNGEEHCYVFRDERRAAQSLAARRKRAAREIAERKELEKKALKRGTLRKRKVVKRALGDKVIVTETVVQQRLARKTEGEIEAEAMGDPSLDGCFVLVSSRKMNLKKALRRYRRRDDVEKLIDALKNVHDIKPMRAWKDECVAGVIFVCMLAGLFTAVMRLLTGTKKRAKSVLELLRDLTLLVKLGENGRILSKRLAGLSDIVRNFLTSPA